MYAGTVINETKVGRTSPEKLIAMFFSIDFSIVRTRPSGFWGLVGVVGVGCLSFGVNGRGQCRVVAAWLCGLHESDFFFITISHCAWQHVISLSKATKKRSKENAFKPRYPKCPQRAVSIHGCPKSTVLARATDV